MIRFLEILLIHREGSEQHRKRECLKSAISIRHICKSYLLQGKWTQQKVDKATDETINKTYTEYKQPELTEKSEIAGKTLGLSLICILPEFLDCLKSRMLTNYGKILRMIRLLKIRLSCSVYVWQFSYACFSGCAYSQQLRS